MTGWARERPATALWTAVFLYAALISIVVQAVALPRWAPDWHAGHGLLKELDAVVYHLQATERARAIQADGWTAWRLRPFGHVPVGIASLVYAGTVPEPWTLVPLNAALHASAAVVLLRILELFAPTRRALLGVLPLVLFPSALVWVAQIGKDGLSLLGLLLVALGWARMAAATRAPAARRGQGLLAATAGAGIAWLPRPYILEVLLVIGAGLALLLSAAAVRRGARGGWARDAIGRAAVRPWLAVLATGSLLLLPGTFSYTDPPRPPGAAPARLAWTRSDWLPAPADRRVEGLAHARQRFLRAFAGAGANVDPGVRLSSARDVGAYLGRAVQISLLAPFPVDWAGAGVNPGAGLMRRAAGGEMIVLYLALAVLPVALWRWRTRLELSVLVLYALTMVLAYGLAVPNLGALFRFRYPFATLLIGLAVATAGAPMPEGLRAGRGARPREARPGALERT